ncbi:hypothetical protein B9Z65_1878 [Elsinoe australis]|uniref:LysM domain-containing protein n=1 Tax=Elsinoe australis TaxID=40998 RepID=A0A2P7YL85_9PEZI|nr:hypothetical protein B9Z65_1878 [Elsinoe australis]
MRSFSLLPLAAIFFADTTFSTALIPGDPALWFPSDAPTACLQAFNTSLTCDNNVQLLNTPTSYVGWNTTGLTNLCTSACYSSLTSMAKTVTAACGSYSPVFNGMTINASQILDFYTYKYNYTCLKGIQYYCLVQDYNWNIPAMVAAGQATWPKYTNKTYPDWANDPINGTNVVDDSGVVVQPYDDPQPLNTWVPNDDTAYQYFYTGGADLDPNYGWNKTLEYDEYPLEVQCAQCPLSRFKLGFASQWGEPWTDVMAQIWANIKLNCKLTDNLAVHPTLDIRGPPKANFSVVWSATPQCDQNLSSSAPSWSLPNVDQLAFKYNVTSAGLIDLNTQMSQTSIENGTYCAPLSCKIAMVQSNVGASRFLANHPEYGAITLSQFLAWNPSAYALQLRAGEYVCIGPPGGAYVPPASTVMQANPTVFTTTMKAPAPTPTGTIPNCGLYYTVKSGDYCNLVALNFSITFSQLIDMNPSLDSACSNLLLGYSYCVGAVNGTTVAHQTTTKQPPTTSAMSATTAPTGITTTKATSTPNTVVTQPAPTSTQAGASTACRKWYVVKSGDTCSIVEQANGITDAQFRAWNTAIDSACTNLWLGYAYCVAGP